MSKEKTTIEFFQAVATGLSHVSNNIEGLLKSIRQDESDLQRMQNIIDDLRDEVKELENELEVMRRGDG